MAHTPEVSYTVLSENNHNWTLRIRASLTAFQYQLKQHDKKASYTSKEEFENMLFQYLKKNISISFNKKKSAIIKKSHLKIGHETDVVFFVTNLPDTIKHLRIQNTSFKNIPENKSIFLFFKNNFSKNQFVINHENNHAIDLKIEDEKLLEEQEKKNSFLCIKKYVLLEKFRYGIIGTVLIIFILFTIKKI